MDASDLQAETLCLYFFLSFLSASSPPLHSGNVRGLSFGCIWGTTERALWLVSPLAGDNRALIARVLTHDVIVFADFRAFGIEPSATGLKLGFCVCRSGDRQHSHGKAN